MSTSQISLGCPSLQKPFRHVCPLLVLMVTLTIATVAAAQEIRPSEEGARVLALDNSWNRALEAKDVNALELLLADTLKSVDIDGSMQSKAEFLASIKAPDYQPAHATTEKSSVEVYGDSAVVIGVFRTLGMYKGKKYSKRERFVDTWTRSNGVWRCVATVTVLISGEKSAD